MTDLSDLPWREQAVLQTIGHEQPITTTEAADLLGTSPGNIRDALRKLEERDLVERRPDPRKPERPLWEASTADHL